MTWCEGVWKYLGEECHSVCLDLPFPSSQWGLIIECPVWHSAQSDYLCSGNQVHAQTFLPKVDMMSSECHLVMYWWCGAFGWWHLHCNYVRVRGYKRMNARGRGSQFWEFRCRAYRAKLIPSRVLWCVPTLGQPGILYLLTTKMCLVYWLLSIGIFLGSNFVFIEFSCLSDHQANRPSLKD